MARKAKTKLKIILPILAVAALGVIIYLTAMDKKVVLGGDSAPTSKDLTAVVDTNFGSFKIKFYPEDAPMTVSNFVSLAQKGYYNGLTLHRIIKNFMIQGGDPIGNGTGGPGYLFEDELNPNSISGKEGYKKGVVAMANAGPNTNGSQFFIMVTDLPLPYNYTIFGKVVEGQNVVDTISLTQTDENDRPLQRVIITGIRILN